MAGSSSWLWPRHWSLRKLFGLVALCAAVATAPRLWPENPLARWNPEVAGYSAAVALVLVVLLPLYWVGDRIWAAIETREERAPRDS